MKHLTPSLALLALTGLATTTASAASIADDLQIKVKGYVQARATLGASAATNNGTDQDYYSNVVPGTTTPPSGVNGVPGSESQALNFGIRRVRLTFEATNTTGWFSNVTLRDEPIELSGDSSTAPANGNTNGVQIFLAYIGKRFKTDSLEQELKIGLNKPYNSDSAIASDQQLFGVDRPLSTLISFEREPGVSYKLTAPFLRAGVDVQNGTNSNRAALAATGPGSGNYDARPSPFYSARIEAAPGKEFMAAKKTESYVGAPGTQIMLGADYQNSGRSYAVADQERTMQVYGPDLLVHYNGLTFLAEYRWTKMHGEATAGAAGNQDIDGKSWDAQAGYAIATEIGLVIEPALRFSVMNFDSSQDERSSWGLNTSRDNAVGNMAGAFTNAGLSSAALASGAANLGSGSQLDVGVNLYWNGQANKTQIGYLRWNAEAGDADASAFYIQQQVTF